MGHPVWPIHYFIMPTFPSYLLFFLFGFFALGAQSQPIQIPTHACEIINTYPHDPAAFTQGLVFHDGHLYEGTGRYGQSTIRKVDLTTGTVLQKVNLEYRYFGEGITIFNNALFQLTWRSKTGFVYNAASFDMEDTFTYATEGWGITHDNTHLIMSDGSDTLYFLNPITFQQEKTQSITANGKPVYNLNELEYVNGLLYANIWEDNRIAIISLQDGTVTAWMDCANLLTREEQRNADVFNGIAYDPQKDRLFVTGKLWPKLFEIKKGKNSSTTPSGVKFK
jgi:glutaminyl-peptide cyclotransferase